MEHNLSPSPWDRRDWLRWAAAGGLAAAAGCNRKTQAVNSASAPTRPPSAPYDQLLKFPGKVPMRGVNDRPPCLETPWEYYKTDLTPNDAFYVRWHLQNIPEVKPEAYRLKVTGHVNAPLELTLDDLRNLPAMSVVAVNQCSGNSRGLFEPHVAGAQWNNGAMGNARWTGVKLADVLKKAGVKAGAVDVAFSAFDTAGPDTVPDFVKSLPVDEANRDDVLLAYDMNGAPLPHLNGFPLRLVVPGWFATYWVKSLKEVSVLPKKFDGYWMAKAYRVPKPGTVDTPDKLAGETVPINRMPVRSFFVTPLPTQPAVVKVGQATPLDGIAFDGGSGIKQVDVSEDGGKTWAPAQLGDDHGKFSFRRWKLSWTPAKPGDYRLLVRATNNAGEVQPMQAGWNRAGYLRNHVESVTVQAVQG